LRKLREENKEVLYNMAKKLDISTSYLSSIELGDRKVPKKFYTKLQKAYHLSDDKINELKELAIIVTSDIKLNINHASLLKKQVSINLARNFNNLDDKVLKEINDLLTKNQKGK
jgi:transcriptional regulator with XRE-family HTH domain